MYPAQDIVRKREEIKDKALDAVRLSLGGLMSVDDLILVNIDLTDDLEKAIELKMVMEQQSLAKKFELDKEKTTGRNPNGPSDSRSQGRNDYRRGIGKKSRHCPVGNCQEMERNTASNCGGGEQSGANIVLPIK